MIRLPPRSTQSRSSPASDVYKRQVHDRPGRHPGERQEELLPAEPAGDVALPYVTGNERPKCSQYVVAGDVTALVIHRLEPVEIPENHADGESCTFRPSQLSPKALLEVAAVVQPCKGVACCLFLQPFLQHGDFLFDARALRDVHDQAAEQHPAPDMHRVAVAIDVDFGTVFAHPPKDVRDVVNLTGRPFADVFRDERPCLLYTSPSP